MTTARPSPRLSVNQLSSYLVASSAQRRRILQDAKYPDTFRVNWYDLARQHITAFVAGGMVDETILTDGIARLLATSAVSSNDAVRLRTNVEALESVLASYSNLKLNGLSATSTMNWEHQHLSIKGVAISVRPEFFLNGTYMNRATVGGIKLYFSKQDSLSDSSASYVACILMRYIQDCGTPLGAVVRQSSCFVYDVFAGRAHAAPQAVAQRRRDIEAACEEITTIWTTV